MIPAFAVVAPIATATAIMWLLRPCCPRNRCYALVAGTPHSSERK